MKKSFSYKRILLIIYLLLTSSCYIYGQTISYSKNPVSLTESLDLIVHLNKKINHTVYVNIQIKNAQNENYLTFNTPFFELQTNNTLLRYSYFQNLYFTHGDNKKLQHPTFGKYNIEASLINYTNQQKIAQTFITVWIDSTTTNTPDRKNKPSFLIENTNEVNLPYDSINSYRNFSRTDIQSSFTLFEIPINTGIGIHTQLDNKETYIDNLYFSLDKDEIMRRIQEKASEIQENYLSTADTSIIKKVFNQSYSEYTNNNKDWYSMLNAYKNDSIQDIVRQIQNLDTNQLLSELNILKERNEYIHYQLDSLNKRIPEYQTPPDSIYNKNDSVKILRRKINELNNSAQTKKEQIQTIEKQVEQLDKYKDIIANKTVLDSLKYKDPEKIIKTYFNPDSLNPSNLINKKLNVLKNIRTLDIGLSNINWSNQAASFLRLNGINFSYDINNFNISAFAGVSSDQNNMLFFRKKDSITDLKFGVNIAYIAKEKQTVNIYNIYTHSREKTEDGTDISSYTSSGITYNYAFSSKFDITIESGISKNIKGDNNPIQFLTSGKVKFSDKKTTLLGEILYKTKDYKANNYFTNPYDNIITNIQITQKILRDKLLINALNILTKNLYSRENNYNNLTNNSNISFNYYPHKSSFIILSGNYFIGTNTINSKKDLLYSVDISNNYNKTINNSLTFNSSQSFQYSYRLSNFLFHNKTPVLELNVLNYNQGSHVNVNINSSIAIKEKHSILMDNNALFIHISDSEKKDFVKQFSNNLLYSIYFNQFAFETGITYMRTSQNDSIINSFAPSLKVQGKVIKNLNIGIQYQYFKNQIFLYQGNKQNNHLLRVYLSYKI